MKTDLAPIILFIYNRPEHTRRTLQALSENMHADGSTLFVFADGPKEGATPDELNAINGARAVIHEKPWCKEVFLIAREKNMGLEKNVIDGITGIINKYGKAIMLEDDMLSSPYFLQYCNDGLSVYENTKQVFSINGFIFPIDFETVAETFLSPVGASSWGWATWADRWNLIENSPDYIREIDNDGFLKARFNVGLDNKMYMLKHMHTWDIRWYYAIFIRNGLGLFTTRSLIRNIGFDGSGTHTGNENMSQEIYASPIPVIHHDCINLKHYSKMLNYIQPEPVSGRQRIKNAIKRMLRW